MVRVILESWSHSVGVIRRAQGQAPKSATGPSCLTSEMRAGQGLAYAGCIRDWRHDAGGQ